MIILRNIYLVIQIRNIYLVFVHGSLLKAPKTHGIPCNKGGKKGVSFVILMR